MEYEDVYPDVPDRFGPATFACPRCGTRRFRTSSFSRELPENGVCQKCRRRQYDDQQVPNTLLVPAREDCGRSFYSMDDDNLSVTSEITIDSACGSSDRSSSTKYPSRRFKPVLENIPTERWTDDRRIAFRAMSGSDQSRRSIFSNETDDSDDLEDQLWNHERLIQHIKNHQIPKDPNPVETKNSEEDLNDSIDPLTFKQDFHPLSSKLAMLSTSDQTMTSSGNVFGMSDSSIQTQGRDSEKYAPPLQTKVDVQAESRFCLTQASDQAPRSSLEESSSHVRGKRIKDKNRTSLTGLDNDQRSEVGEKDANRFSLNLGDFSSMRAVAAAAESSDTSPNEREGCEGERNRYRRSLDMDDLPKNASRRKKKDANRFSLNLGDLSSLRAAAAAVESFDTSSNERESGERERIRIGRSLIVDDLPENASRRKRGEERGPNRFSLSLNHLSSARFIDTGPLDVSDAEERNNAFVWSSLDVLRMAADNSDFAVDMDANPRSCQPQRISTVGQAIDMLSCDDDSDLAAAALDALLDLCELSDENKLKLAKTDASCIKRVVTSNLTAPKMRETACKVLRCVTTDRASAAALSHPIVEGIILALSAYEKDEVTFSDEFAIAAMETLANLAQEPSNHSRLIAGGVLPLLTEAMCNTSEEICLIVCTILAELSASCNLILNQQIVNQGCLNSLLASMRTMIGHRKIQKEALRALGNLSELTDAMKVISDNIDIVLNTFRRHGKSKFAQVGVRDYFGLAKYTVLTLLNRLRIFQVSVSLILSRISTHESALEVLNHPSFDALAQVCSISKVSFLDSRSECVFRLWNRIPRGSRFKFLVAGC